VLELEPTPDILAELGRSKKSQVLVGFAAETDDLEKNAPRSCSARGLISLWPMTPARLRRTQVGPSFIGGEGKIERLAELPKSEVAKAIIERAVRLVR